MCTQSTSLAIAGAWGYIGRKFLEGAQLLRLETSVFDTGPTPPDVDRTKVVLYDRERDFYLQQADLFHLALHPEHRSVGFDMLLQRGCSESIAILCEKPMALPQCPDACRAAVDAVARSGAVLLYDFPELFDPITRRVIDFLGRHRTVDMDSITTQRSKDREDPSNDRNKKRMVHIQYQESVHCIAFVLHILARLKGSLDAVFADGLIVTAESQPYVPPNPCLYPYVVDGRCQYCLTLGEVSIDGLTDFKRGASWAKRRVLTGRADGRPFSITIDFLEGKKQLWINGAPQPDVVDTNSYAEVIREYDSLRRNVPLKDIKDGLYPNPAFARATYQLSSALWHSSLMQRTIRLGSLDKLLQFDAGFAEAAERFSRY